MENRNPVLELQNAVRKSVCNGSLKRDYPILLEQCRKDGISSYILNLFIVTAQAKLKNPTETYVKYHHPKELEREPVEIEKIKFVEKIPLKYRVYKILFFSLLFVIVVLWTGRETTMFGPKSKSTEAAKADLYTADTMGGSTVADSMFGSKAKFTEAARADLYAVDTIGGSIVVDSVPNTSPSTPRIPKDFVLVPAGRLKHLFCDYDDKWNKIYKDWDVDSFYICKYEVTQAEYEKIMGVNPSKYRGDEIPVHNISNFEAIQYCQKRSIEEGYDGFYEISDSGVKFNKNGNGYRLPTDHEWAFAARSGEKPTSYAAGDNLTEIAWYGRNSGNRPHKIAQKKPNGRELYDMNGNVSEMSHTGINKISPKGGSYREWPYDGHVFHEHDARGYAIGKFTNREKDVTAGIRLVFMPRGIGVPKDLNRYFKMN